MNKLSGGGGGSRGIGGVGSNKGPPPGYIPGLGRGASGFTTRGDVAPIAASNSAATAAVSAAASAAASGGSRSAEMRAARMLLAQQQQQQQQGGAGRGRGRGMGRGDNDDETGVAVGGTYDPFTGYSTTAGGGVDGQYDDDDDEADRIWAAIDERMKHKRRRKNNENGDDDTAGDSGAKASISAQFVDLKQQLSSVTEEEWASIPDTSGDPSLRHKQHNKKQEVFTPLTDSLLEQRSHLNLDATAGNKTAAAAANNASVGGFQSVVSNLSGLSAARGAVLGMSLDRMKKDTSEDKNDNAIDPQGYLTSLAEASATSTTVGGTSTNMVLTAASLGDIHKARLLLQSVRETNPQHGSGWIASARVEEAAGKILEARKIIQQACQVCKDNEDVWLEAARLHPPDMAKRILATAARTLPHKVKIFFQAAELENSITAKRAVLRKGLEANPTSVTLWKAAIELEDDDQVAKVLLRVAVDKVPQEVDLWLALAKLETYENAQKVLNKARKALPTERAIWMAAAKLEEAQQQPKQEQDITHENGDSKDSIANKIDKIVQRAVAILAKYAAVVTREQWLQEAETAESSGFPQTAAAIIKYTISQDVEDEDRPLVWADDAKSCLARGSVATARAILAQALQVYPSKRSFWMQAVELERKHGTVKTLDRVLASASERLPRIEIFWLLRAKEQWMAGHIDAARDVLTQAFAANPDSEAVWLAAAKLEWETGEIERARVLFQRARERAPSARVYMKSALLEREQKQSRAALKLIEEGIKQYPKFAKLYMMGGQICACDEPKEKSSLDRARRFYQRGLEECPNNTVLWTLASRLEERAWTFVENDPSSASSTSVSCFTKARGLLDLGRLKNPKNAELWLESTRLERRAGNVKLAESFLAKALQECPNSGLLLAEDVYTCTRVKKKSKSSIAIQRCPEDPHVICAVATFFASERKVDKARKWFARAVVLNPDDGDAWARYYLLELQLLQKLSALKSESEQQQQQQQLVESVKQQCVAAEPKHGEIWASVSKDMANRGKSIGEILELASERVQEELNNQQQTVTN